MAGVELAVVRGDEGLRLRNRSGRTVIVKGYDGEQYLRFKPDGTVEANQRSAATYINVDRFGLQEVPENALPGASPRWKPVAQGGTYTWFDHRIHLTASRPPARFTRQKKLTKVFDWRVPLIVGATNVRATGTLVWDPDDESSGFPVWIVIAALLGAVILLLLVLVRRRRLRPRQQDRTTGEAW